MQLPCSHVGHVFRIRTPYVEDDTSQNSKKWLRLTSGLNSRPVCWRAGGTFGTCPPTAEKSFRLDH